MLFQQLLCERALPQPHHEQHATIPEESGVRALRMPGRVSPVRAPGVAALVQVGATVQVRRMVAHLLVLFYAMREERSSTLRTNKVSIWCHRVGILSM